MSVGTAAVVGVTLLALAACAETPGRLPPPAVPDADPDAGAELIADVGCGACHMIPGIRGADGMVGPPLEDFGRRSFIAGQLANNEQNLVRWLIDPPAVEPGTGMPDLGLTQDEARDVAAYLLSLR